MKSFIPVVVLSSIITSATNALAFEPQFKPLYEPGNGGAIVSVEVSPHDPNLVISTGDMLGVATSFDGGKLWQPTFGFSSYEMGSLTFHPTNPNVVWTGSCMGPYVSTDRGVHWQARRQGMPPVSGGSYSCIIESVVFDPDQPARLLAFGGSSRRWNTSPSFGQIWQSLDDGVTWTILTTLTNDGSTTQTVNGGNIASNIVWANYLPGSTSELHAVLDGGAWLKSVDDGLTWQRVKPEGVVGPIDFVRFDPADAMNVYVSTSNFLPEGAARRTPGGVFKSTDGGKTFAPIMTGIRTIDSDDAGQSMLTSTFSRVAISKSDPKTLYVNDRAWNASIIYKSTDAGATWNPVAGRKPYGHDYLFAGAPDAIPNPQTATRAGVSLHLSIDPNNAQRVYTYNTEYVLSTQDGGKTWTDMTSTPVGSVNGVTTWRGTGWNGWCSREVRFNPYSPRQIVIQMMDAGRAWISDDDGQSWRFAETGLQPWLAGKAVAFTRDGHIYGTTGQFGTMNGLTRSTDGGKTWTSVVGGDLKLHNNDWGVSGSMGGVVAHPDQSSRVWVVVNGNLMYSSDAGESFANVEESKSGFDWLEPDPSRPGNFYASHKSGIFYFEDGKGLTFIGGPKAENELVMHVDANGRLYVPQWRTGRTGVWRYTPKSQAWERLIDESQAFDVATDPKDPTRIVMVTSMHPYYDTAGGNGVWFSQDDGKTWGQSNKGLGMLRAQCVEFDPKNGERFIVGTLGQGYYQATWPRGEKIDTPRRYEQVPEDLAWVMIDTGLPKVVNPSFTDISRSSDLKNGVAGWDARWLMHGQLDAVRDDKVFASDPASMRVDATAVDGKPAMGIVGQNVAGQAGTRFVLNAKLKSKGDVKVSLGIQGFKENWETTANEQTGFVQGTTDWTQTGKAVELPEGTVRFRIGLYVEGVGSAWVDDVELVEQK